MRIYLNTKFFCTLLIYISLLFTASAQPKSPYLIKDVKEAKATLDEWRKNPYHNAELYKTNFNTPLIQRVKIAPPFLIKTLELMDERTYSSYQPSDAELALVQECINSLPALHQRELQIKLLGIYFVEENFMGTGYADITFDQNYQDKYLIIINKKVLSLNLSQWLTWKENSCFIQDNTAYSLSITSDETQPGLLGILLHEASHVIDYSCRFTPFVGPGDYLKNLIHDVNISTKKFSSPWKGIRKYNPKFATFPYQNQLSFYGLKGAPKIPLSQAVDVYKALEKTPFASLYGSTQRAEDFAEMVMFHHLCHVMGLEYKISIKKNQRELYHYHPFKNQQVRKRMRGPSKIIYKK
jgi:hypothetical protein